MDWAVTLYVPPFLLLKFYICLIKHIGKIMPFYDKPFDLKLDKRRKIDLVDDMVDLEIDLVDDEQPIWITNKKVPFKGILRDLKDWQTRYPFYKFYTGLVRPAGLAADKAIAVTPQYALRFCLGRVRSADDMYMCFAVNKDCTVLLQYVDGEVSEFPFAITKDASARNVINRMSVQQFIRKMGAEFQFFIVYR